MPHDYRYYKRRLKLLWQYVDAMQDRLRADYDAQLEYLRHQRQPLDEYDIYSHLVSRLRLDVGAEILGAVKGFLR
ncbi:MAG: hypothetical protein LBN05_02915 [Oscillospiraceae bacterium]|jgi:uncharacterized protein YjaG (DUF416 family)|nr:hypothetical protein [Oscillospiraceae bacterium]